MPLDVLDWSTASLEPTSHTTEDTSRGRHKVRTVHVQPLTTNAVPFPYAAQAVLLEHTTIGRGNGKIHTIVELAVTTAPPGTADAEDISRLVRSQ